MQFVKIDKIKFTGKQNIDWKGVKKSMGIFVGKNAEVKETGDIIQINSGTLEEFTGSRYTIKLRGALATMIVKSNNHGMYLYDIIDIKKEASNPEGLNN